MSAHARRGGAVTQANFDKAIVELEKQTQAQIDTGALPGVVIAVAHQGKVVYGKRGR